MPYVEIHQARTLRLEILDKDGNVDETLLPDLPKAELDRLVVQLLRMMIRMRVFDDKAIALQRQGRMGTFGSMRGQEAAQAGLALNIRPSDWLAPSIREQGVLDARGVPMHYYYGFCKGDERASRFPADTVRSLPQSIPVGSQLLHAAGLGMALRLRKEDAAAIGFGGDGATSEGDFHEALNFAGVFKAKTLFYIQNNGWAISVPFHQQTAAASIAQRAHAYGIDGLQVDGNDALAVYVATKQALERIRTGEGPMLIEALTYRMESHTTADDHRRYRKPEDLEYWAQRDPIDRMRIFAERRGLWTEADEAAHREAVAAQVEQEVAKLEAIPPPKPADIFDYMYWDMPETLREQREQLLEEVG